MMEEEVKIEKIEYPDGRKDVCIMAPKLEMFDNSNTYNDAIPQDEEKK